MIAILSGLPKPEMPDVCKPMLQRGSIRVRAAARPNKRRNIAARQYFVVRAGD